MTFCATLTKKAYVIVIQVVNAINYGHYGFISLHERSFFLPFVLLSKLREKFPKRVHFLTCFTCEGEVWLVI